MKAKKKILSVEYRATKAEHDAEDRVTKAEHDAARETDRAKIEVLKVAQLAEAKETDLTERVAATEKPPRSSLPWHRRDLRWYWPGRMPSCPRPEGTLSWRKPATHTPSRESNGRRIWQDIKPCHMSGRHRARPSGGIRRGCSGDGERLR